MLKQVVSICSWDAVRSVASVSSVPNSAVRRMEAAQAGVSYWGPARELEVTRQPGTPLGLTIWGGTVDLGNRWAHWVVS